MPSFNVTMRRVETYVVQVDADSKEAALEKADKLEESVVREPDNYVEADWLPSDTENDVQELSPEEVDATPRRRWEVYCISSMWCEVEAPTQAEAMDLAVEEGDWQSCDGDEVGINHISEIREVDEHGNTIGEPTEFVEITYLHDKKET